MYEIPPLPYAYSDLEPEIDEETMRIHHTKHHQAYVDKLNAAIEKHPELREKRLLDMIYNSDEVHPEVRQQIINNGGGHFTHSFFWENMTRAEETGSVVGTAIGAAIEKQFGSLENFFTEFKNCAASLFGSGWTWLLVSETGDLELMNTANHNLPPIGKRPIMIFDVWEHAYYLKFQNRRPEYIEAFLKVVNWQKVNDRFIEARAN